MSKYQRRLVRLATDIVEQTGNRAGAAEIATIELRLALLVLRPWVELEQLSALWAAAVDNHSRHKSPSVPAAADMIVRELKMLGRLDGATRAAPSSSPGA